MCMPRSASYVQLRGLAEGPQDDNVAIHVEDFDIEKSIIIVRYMAVVYRQKRKSSDRRESRERAYVVSVNWYRQSASTGDETAEK